MLGFRFLSPSARTQLLRLSVRSGTIGSNDAVMSGRRPAIKGEFGSATVTGAVMSPAFERGVYPLALMFVR